MDTDPNAPTRPTQRAILYCAIGVFLWSLTFIQRPHEEWDATPRFHVSADRVATGLPLPWIGWTTLKVTGDAPPLNELPDGREWKPGVYFDPRRFVFVPAFALAIAAMIVFAGARASARMRKQQALPSRKSVVAIALGAAVMGTLIPTNPSPIGLGLGLALMVGLVAATWDRPRAITVACYVVLAVATTWWVQRMTSHFWTRLKPIEGFSWRDDALATVSLVTFAFLVVMGVHMLRRFLCRVSARASSHAK